jgi:hypothetical protein
VKQAQQQPTGIELAEVIVVLAILIPLFFLFLSYMATISRGFGL